MAPLPLITYNSSLTSLITASTCQLLPQQPSRTSSSTLELAGRLTWTKSVTSSSGQSDFRPHRLLAVGRRSRMIQMSPGSVVLCMSVCLSVCQSVCLEHTSEPCKKGWTDREPIWGVDSYDFKESCIRWGLNPPPKKGALLLVSRLFILLTLLALDHLYPITINLTLTLTLTLILTGYEYPDTLLWVCMTLRFKVSNSDWLRRARQHVATLIWTHYFVLSQYLPFSINIILKNLLSGGNFPT